MSLVLSQCRVRSSSFPLIFQARRFHACACASCVHPSVRWIPPELNASDAESRQQTHSHEHSALALLATCSPKPQVLSQQTMAPKRWRELRRTVLQSRRHLFLVRISCLHWALLLQPERTVTHKQRLPTSERELELPTRSEADVPPDASNGDNDVSSSSSSAGAVRTKQAQAKRLAESWQRHYWLVEAHVTASTRKLTFLERTAVRPLTHSNYQKNGAHLRGLPRTGRISSSLRRRNRRRAAAVLGELLLVASLMHLMPEFGHCGLEKTLLPTPHPSHPSSLPPSRKHNSLILTIFLIFLNFSQIFSF